jgi:hypothetical protein
MGDDLTLVGRRIVFSAPARGLKDTPRFSTRGTILRALRIPFRQSQRQLALGVELDQPEGKDGDQSWITFFPCGESLVKLEGGEMVVGSTSLATINFVTMTSREVCDEIYCPFYFCEYEVILLPRATGASSPLAGTEPMKESATR